MNILKFIFACILILAWIPFATVLGVIYHIGVAAGDTIEFMSRNLSDITSAPQLRRENKQLKRQIYDMEDDLEGLGYQLIKRESEIERLKKGN